MKSWTKPEGKENLIGCKKVDWSIFKYGTQIPIVFHEDFENANKSTHIEKGESEDVKLMLDEEEFSAKLVNINNNQERDTLQLRYDGNKEFIGLLKDKFSFSYNYLKEKYENNEEGGYHKTPEEKAEYIEFYETDKSFNYKLKLIATKEVQKPNIWWVNQGSSYDQKEEKGRLWAPIESDGRNMYHWETMTEVKPGDIILHYANGAIRAVSKAQEAAQEVTKPEDLKSKRWEEKGRKIEVDFYELNPEIELEKFNHELKNLDINKGPINSKGRVNQGYLFYFNSSGLKIIQEQSPETDWPDFSRLDAPIVTQISTKTIIEKVYKYISNKGFNYPQGMIKNFYLSLKTKPFVLLAGISGTGKTKMVQLFAEAINCNSNNGRFKLTSVRPDWNDSSDLLGYKNLQGKFVPGPMINIIKNANHDPRNIYIVCLDEMNLARVEYYFSEFLSKMETRRYEQGRIVTDKLFNKDYFERDEDREMYGNLIIPDNLYIVGTVNMDETTHPFSKKVLDRANTIEFSEVDLSRYNLNNEETTVKLINGVKNDFLRADFLNLNDCPVENQEIVSQIIIRLQKINKILEKASLHVGYRIRDEIIFYMLYNQRYSLLAEEQAFDFQLMQKILPRIQGSSGRIKEVLKGLFEYTAGTQFEEKINIGDDAINYVENNPSLIYPRSAIKLAEMIKKMEEDRFTAYWI